MDDEQIAKMKSALSSGRRLGWRDPAGPLREIIKVIDADECGPTGEPAGVFRDGKWCALWAVCPEDIIEFQPLFMSAWEG